ncbi:TRAP transporter small permease [Hominifimenecus sp. rT4P-3]|uniref:TRAP transporter small permease n=1 Tax=Hominifimenecus sp. rT4P-3 TaxID=3242979 RepID=UPI003DA1FDC8
MKKKGWKAFLRALDEGFEEKIAMVVMVLIAIFMGMQVCARYVFNSSLSWPEEICVYMLIWMGMISLSYCIRKNSSIKVEMLINLFPIKVRRIFHILEDVISIVFYGFLCIPAWQLLGKAIRSGQVSAALHLPMYFIQIAPLIAFALAVIRSVQDIYFNAKGFHEKAQEDER